MSQAHKDAFEAIRREHDDVVTALQMSMRSPRRGAPGNAAYDPRRLEVAVATAGDAYALLLIATSERFLRDYLRSIGIDVGDEPKLSTLIDRTYKEFNRANPLSRIHDKSKMHDLRVNRNDYAHGHRTSVFPTVPTVVARLGEFFARIP